MELATELLNLIVPTQCPGCGKWDTTLCANCAALARAQPHEWQLGEAGELRGWSLGRYADEMRELVLAAKHRRWVRLDGWLQAAGWSLGQAVVPEPGILATPKVGDCAIPAPYCSWDPAGRAREIARGEPSSSRVLNQHEDGVSVVPIPSSWRRRWDGMLITPSIAAATTAALRSRGFDAHLVPALRMGWTEHSQRGGGKHQRYHRRSMILQTGVHQRVVLVDDVLTTGATLLSAAQALPGSVKTVVAVTLARA